MEFRLLEPLPADTRRELLARARRRRFAAGEVIFHEGDPGDAMHLLAKGHVAIRVTTPLGDTATLRVLRAGDHFGELSVVSPAPRNATIVALDATETLVVHRDDVDQLRRDHPAVDRFLVDTLVQEVRRLSILLAEALYLPVEKRTWRRLLALTTIYARDTDPTTVIPLTQEDVAGIVGTTRPTINRLLRDAERDGLLRMSRGRIDVIDRAALERRSR
ncbi:MAG TPA: Crp/Fnr family transcriptional regulator [Acidimicrobiia bacterium]|jgi:CRP-like cAMP-binding protein